MGRQGDGSPGVSGAGVGALLMEMGGGRGSGSCGKELNIWAGCTLKKLWKKRGRGGGKHTNTHTHMHAHAHTHTHISMTIPRCMHHHHISWRGRWHLQTHYDRNIGLWRHWSEFSSVLVPALPAGICPWWRHQMETFSALLAFCAGNS